MQSKCAPYTLDSISMVRVFFYLCILKEAAETVSKQARTLCRIVIIMRLQAPVQSLVISMLVYWCALYVGRILRGQCRKMTDAVHTTPHLLCV